MDQLPEAAGELKQAPSDCPLIDLNDPSKNMPSPLQLPPATSQLPLAPSTRLATALLSCVKDLLLSVKARLRDAEQNNRYNCGHNCMFIRCHACKYIWRE